MAIVLDADRPVVRLWLLIRGVLVLYLNGIGLSESQTGLLLTLTLIGDTLVSLWLTTRANRRICGHLRLQSSAVAATDPLYSAEAPIRLVCGLSDLWTPPEQAPFNLRLFESDMVPSGFECNSVAEHSFLAPTVLA